MMINGGKLFPLNVLSYICKMFSVFTFHLVCYSDIVFFLLILLIHDSGKDKTSSRKFTHSESFINTQTFFGGESAVCFFLLLSLHYNF